MIVSEIQWIKRSLIAIIIVGCTMTLTSCGVNVQKPKSKTYQTALNLIKQGRQDAAEEILSKAVQLDVKNQRLVFFMGVCARSRWMKRDALPIFGYVSELNQDSPEGKCSALMLAIDTQKEYEDNFKALEDLQKSNPDDVLILWMCAVACRELGKRDAPREYSEKGAMYYAKLLEQLDPGPVLLHQTYANILSEELGRHEEALKHRHIALRLEPAPWSYQGMANTLSNLGRYTEADEYYQKCVDLAPDKPTYLASWAWSMGRRGDHEKAYELYEKAAEIAPNHSRSWRNLGRCANKLNRQDDARRFYAKAAALENKRK